MLSETTSLKFLIAIAMAGAIAVATSVWASAPQTPPAGEAIDITAMMTTTNVATMPVIYVDQPF